MKIFFLFASALFSLTLFAQETVKKESNSSGNKEVYYVLQADKKVKHGAYEKLGLAGDVLTEGFYKNGSKDSTWIEYWIYPVVKSKGSYNVDDRTGIWEFYNRQGVLEQQFDYTKKALLYDQSIDGTKNKKYKIFKGADTIETTLDRPPLYIGGATKMQNALMKGFHFPKVAIMNNVGNGQIKIGFVVSKEGKADSFKIISGMGYGYDEEVLRLTKQIADGWLPAIYQGRAVDAENFVSISIKVFGAN